ncbi:hypothetical protein DFH08DRAFT_963196 [Mycena albidolilacea]|uniref:Uncharacterized protein n=1 Tax=Mycena albidolilacea TaxID=1033008 RepID=A0AAD6ZVJ7_9AGAR|nr:hypothetical protein DFH08DRAFT_963196 [Mycena albidolilacea]
MHNICHLRARHLAPSSPSKAHYALRFVSSFSRAVPTQYPPSASPPSSQFLSLSEAHYASRFASSSSRIMPAQHRPGTSSPPGSFSSLRQAQYLPLYSPSSSRIMPVEHDHPRTHHPRFLPRGNPSMLCITPPPLEPCPPLQDLSTHTFAPLYPPQISPSYPQSGSLHPHPQRLLRYMGMGAPRSEALDNGLPLSWLRHESGTGYPLPIGAGSYKQAEQEPWPEDRPR